MHSSLNKCFYHIRQWFAGGCTLHVCVLPVNFSPPTKITLLSSPFCLFLTQPRVRFMKKPGRLGSVFLLHFEPSAQPLPSAVAFLSQLEFKYSSQFILETPTAPLCQVQGDPLQFPISFSFFPFSFPSSSPFPFSSPLPPPPPFFLGDRGFFVLGVTD